MRHSKTDTKAYDLADAEAEWNILHHARWGQFDAPLNCARHQPGGRDGGMRSEPLNDVRIVFSRKKNKHYFFKSQSSTGQGTVITKFVFIKYHLARDRMLR